jgi:hypothetical protein
MKRKAKKVNLPNTSRGNSPGHTLQTRNEVKETGGLAIQFSGSLTGS